MGHNLSVAHVIAPASFIFDFAMQQYGMSFSRPNMLDVHNANPAAFSPYAYAIPAFFAPQQLLQLVWLYRLVFAKDVTIAERDAMVDFAPWYTLGNICIGLWLPFWNSERMWLAQACVTVNSAAQLLYYYTRLPEDESAKWTRWNATTFAAIGVLDFLHNGAIAVAPRTAPNILTEVLTGVGFLGAAIAPKTDMLMGLCLAYDLAALALGQFQFKLDRSGVWPGLLGAYSIGTLGLTLLRARGKK